MSKMDALLAVDEVIESMPEDFVIKPYLLAHKAEARDMLPTEYNEAETMELFRKEGREEGRKEERGENIKSLMKSLGCTIERAMELLSIPEADRVHILVAV